MPIYEYRCSRCGHELEALQKISEAPLSACPACNEAALVKKVSAAGFQLKGSGWYATDFRGSGSKPAADVDASKSDASKSDASKSDASKSDAAKSDAPKSDAPKSDAAKSDAGKSDGAKSADGKSSSGKSGDTKGESKSAPAAGR